MIIYFGVYFERLNFENMETINRINISEIRFPLGTYKWLKNGLGIRLIYECPFGSSRSKPKENQNNVGGYSNFPCTELDFLNPALYWLLLKRRRKRCFSVRPIYQRCPISGTFQKNFPELNEDREQPFRYLRMSPKGFNHENSIIKRTKKFRILVSPEE